MGSESGRNFEDSLTRPYNRGASDKDLTLVAGKAAECLLAIFLQIAKNIGKSKEVRLIILKIQLFCHRLICQSVDLRKYNLDTEFNNNPRVWVVLVLFK